MSQGTQRQVCVPQLQVGRFVPRGGTQDNTRCLGSQVTRQKNVPSLVPPKVLNVNTATRVCYVSSYCFTPANTRLQWDTLLRIARKRPRRLVVTAGMFFYLISPRPSNTLFPLNMLQCTLSSTPLTVHHISYNAHRRYLTTPINNP